ncbi:F-box DNA helicase 1 [Phyllopteryx taeniolatus]|uniref:F-box DNA helicase 1 n=1 Tax=Phyllopteryx taeniolatus TaxID=161469 RepID=UPI002AD480C7|nr:F-box DNA helicase 1 [Phyllopteryx taeniolatus]
MEVAVKGRAKRKHLNAEDLEKSEVVLEALTNPPNISRSRSNPSKRNTRTTIKRRKCALVTSTCTEGLHGERAPQDEDSSDEDDEDLLPSGLEREEEPENKDIDYFDGITAEMFEDEFDGSEKMVHEEPAVEALPDATYGLLGSSKELLQPRGHIDDLPEEVLRQILSLLPARDMYRSAGLVCHRWRNMIEDAKSTGVSLCKRCVGTRVGPIALLMTDSVFSMVEVPDSCIRPISPY